jgi:hypothetical protein
MAESFLGKIVEWRILTEQHDIEGLMQVRVLLWKGCQRQTPRYANFARAF